LFFFVSFLGKPVSKSKLNHLLIILINIKKNTYLS